MSPFAVVVLFAQACLIQSVMSQYGCSSSYNNYNLAGLSPAISVTPSINQGSSYLGGCTGNVALGTSNLRSSGINVAVGSSNLGSSAINSVSAGSCGSYGGQGTGQVGVAGDVSASGDTVVVGSVPVLGAVDFCGSIPASGSVSISGQCGCGCN